MLDAPLSLAIHARPPDPALVTDVAIVGAGLAGLVCAQDLGRAGVQCTVLEASDAIGGRVRTDAVDGFLLDRGFQILLTAYPQVRKRIDIGALGLAKFEPGAVVRTESGLHRLSNPLRRPGQLPRTLASPIGSPADKLRAAALVLDVCTHSVRHLLRRPDASTASRLAQAGFSSSFIQSFWRPLFAGVQLDPDLEVSSRRFDLILRMLTLGSTGLPREGMGAIPAQIAAQPYGGCVRLNSPVAGSTGARSSLRTASASARRLWSSPPRARALTVCSETACPIPGHAPPRAAGSPWAHLRCADHLSSSKARGSGRRSTWW